MYARLGFAVAAVEAAESPGAGAAVGRAAAAGRGRPVVAGARASRRRSTSSTGTGWSSRCASVVNDPVVGDEGGLTATRDYRTYAEAFADSAARKWEPVRDARAARPDRRHRLRRRGGAGAGRPGAGAARERPDRRRGGPAPVRGVRAQEGAGGLHATPTSTSTAATCSAARCSRPRSVDTTLTFALTHEIWSYGAAAGLAAARSPRRSTTTPCPAGSGSTATSAAPTAATGRCVLRLDATTATTPRSRARPRRAAAEQVAAYVAGLSTRARLDQFAADFRVPVRRTSRSATHVALPLGDAMDFLTRKDYTDNWLSETQEQFCGLEFADWKALLTDVGFEVDPASRACRNDWIVEQPARPGGRADRPGRRPARLAGDPRAAGRPPPAEHLSPASTRRATRRRGKTSAGSGVRELPHDAHRRSPVCVTYVIGPAYR